MTQPKTAFISGVGRNIGRTIALHLAGQGVNVVVNNAAIRRPPPSTQTQSDSQFSLLRRFIRHSPAKPRPMSAMALGSGTSFVSDTKTGPAQAVRVPRVPR